MKEDLITKIKSRGYWRINFRPLTHEILLKDLTTCQEIVSKHSVEMRGWDYPHIPRRLDDESNIDRGANYVRGWVEWHNHIEFWHMYQSGQFLHYRALHEDWPEVDVWEMNQWINEKKKLQPGEWTGVIGMNWFISEVFEFLSRIAQEGIYDKGVEVSITLHNTENRQLRVDGQTRIPFSYPRITTAKDIAYQVVLTREQVADPKSQAVEAIKYFYDRFGWNPSDDQVRQDQDELYRIKMGRG